MEPGYYLGETIAVDILSVASVDHPAMWASFLIAATIAVRILLLRQHSESRTQSVAVPADARRPIRRTVPRQPWN